MLLDAFTRKLFSAWLRNRYRSETASQRAEKREVRRLMLAEIREYPESLENSSWDEIERRSIVTY